MNLLLLLLLNPTKTLKFLYTWLAQSLLVILRRGLLPHLPHYQTLRIQLARAYLSSASFTFPDITHRLPVGPVSAERAWKVAGTGFTAYIVPGTKELLVREVSSEVPNSRCIVLYAHGGGYARGEAKMYLKYMEQWVQAAAGSGLDLTFLSLEYPLSGEAPHPAQRNAFIGAYKYLLNKGISPSSIIFMGDSAGGGLCILSSIECKHLGLPQPAGSVLVSPWLDMTSRAYEGGNALVETDYIITANAFVPLLVKQWLGGAAPDDPDVNPLFRQPQELKGLNRQLILIGAGEFALQEGKDWASLCEKAGVKRKLVCEYGQLHVYALGSAWLAPKVRQETEANILRWIKDCINTAA